MKNGGLNIFRNVSRFLKDVFIKNINKEISGEILIINPQDKVSSSTYLSTSKNKISVGGRGLDTFEIQRARTASGDGVALNIKAGDGFGTDKTGGDLNLYGGASTGNINGGALRFWQAARSGSTNSTLNTWTEMFNTEITQSRINFLGLTTLYFPDKDAKISTDQSIELILDVDNDDTDRYLAIKDSAITRALFPDEGNLYLMSASNSTGLFLDAINSRISAGSKAAHSGTNANTDNTGGANQAGINLTVAGGAGTGTGNGGGISFGTYPAGSSSTAVNSTYEEKMAMDKDGNLQLDGGITTGSTSFVNSSGVVQVASQGTIDHDSLANFVAAEHYRWDNDISGTATINAANIPTLNQSTTGNAATATALATARNINGVSFDGTGDITVTAAGSTLSDTVTVGKGGTGATSLTSNSILTGNGTSAVQAESTLSYDSEILDIGADDNGAATVRRLRHTDDEGGDLYIRGGDATGTNKAGGDLQIFGGRATGNAAGGAVIIQAGETNASSGTTLRGTNVIASFRTDGDTLLQGNLIFEGSVPDAHETTFSITNPTADRTITVPNSSGTMALTGVNYTYQYISFTGNSTVPSDGDWITVSANGISNHSWNVNLGSGGTTVDTSTVTIPTGNICQGIIVPYDCVLVGYSSLIRSVGNYQSKVGLAVGVPTYNDFATFDCTLRAYNAADISAGPDTNYSQRPVRADNLSVNYSMSAGHVIFPLIGSVASNSRTVQWNCTLVLKTLLP